MAFLFLQPAFSCIEKDVKALLLIFHAVVFSWSAENVYIS